MVLVLEPAWKSIKGVSFENASFRNENFSFAVNLDQVSEMLHGIRQISKVRMHFNLTNH